jgi:hypothetical protein
MISMRTTPVEAEQSAVVRSDSLELVAPGLSAPEKSLQVAAVCWVLAGWDRSAEFKLAMDGWAEFGLSRFSASRGLDRLERVELVFVDRMSGRSPIVTILDATHSANDIDGSEGQCHRYAFDYERS